MAEKTPYAASFVVIGLLSMSFVDRMRFFEQVLVPLVVATGVAGSMMVVRRTSKRAPQRF